MSRLFGLLVAVAVARAFCLFVFLSFFQPGSLLTCAFTFWVPVGETDAQTAVRTALLVIDIQNDFMPPSGSLAVNDAFAAVDVRVLIWLSKFIQSSNTSFFCFPLPTIEQVINQLRTKVDFDLTVFTQDWHPADHISFYVNNKDVPGAALFHPTYLPRCNCTQVWHFHHHHHHHPD